MKLKIKSLLVIFISLGILILTSCNNSEEKLSLEFEKYTLDNGLDVILHQDWSDPIVAVAIQYHVGSSRETPGKTGFAHLFEHMMFQQSENVGQDQFFKMIQQSGGTLNGGTNTDGTVYYEVVPKNAAEMVLWLEADRMGFLTNTVTQSAFANQQDIVLNEKRQRVDNNPYGHNNYVIHKNLFPDSHPYNWQVIGEMEDLLNATVEDAKAFHDSYYVPNNATIVIAGDFESAEMKELVEKYFGEIPPGEKVRDLDPIPVKLDETIRLYHEDNFAKTPLLTMVWPTVEQYHPDAYALDFLAQILGNGKKAPMYKVLVKEKQLCSSAGVYNDAMELCGKFTVSIPGNGGTSLTDVETAVFEAFQKFENEGITDIDLEKIKAGLETNFYNGISSVLGKSFQLARYNEYAGKPGYIINDIERIKAVTIGDIERVYEKYIKDQAFVLTSFVPKGSLELCAKDCLKAEIVEENANNSVKVAKISQTEEVYEKTPSSFDRSVVPVQGPDPELNVPEVWRTEMNNGMRLLGIEHNELPLVQYSLGIEGGHLLDPAGKSGVANLLATLLMEGTANKTPEELEEAIDLLGASVRLSAGLESIDINVNCISRNLDKTNELIKEILIQPRWDEEELAIAKMKVINNLKRNAANPNNISYQAFNNLLFGKGSLLATSVSGTVESVEMITMDDLKDYYKNYFSPSVASLIVVGDIDKVSAEASFKPLSDAWEAKFVKAPGQEINASTAASKIYFVDFPGAKQSVIRIGHLYEPGDHYENYAAMIANYKLGGSFNGVLNMILREEKGFTYGARSDFSHSKTYGTFSASSSVRSDATLESVSIFRDEINKYLEGISKEDMVFTRDAMLKSNARYYETLGALQGMLQEIYDYDLPDDHVYREEEILKSMTPEQHREICKKYIHPDNMFYVVVGDAASQLEPLKKIGLGEPELLKVD